MADIDTLLALVSLLKSDAAQLRRMVDLAKFGGAETGVRVKSPDLLVANLDESAAAILALLDDVERLRAALRGSQKAIREMRSNGAPTAWWDDIEAANIAALSAHP